MEDKSNLNIKVQELCDRFATTDTLKEMSTLQTDVDKDEAALKWVALAILHGIDINAKKISITKSQDGEVGVTVKYRKSELPSPGTEIGDKIIQTVREISPSEGDNGKAPLALGIRDNSSEINIKLKKKDGAEKLTIEFLE